MTFFFDMAMAPLDKLSETSIGSISGVSPTATANAKRRACVTFPLENAFIANMAIARMSMKRSISQVKLRIPLSKLVSTVIEASLREILPNWVARPVLMTTPKPVPLTTLEPIKTILVRSETELLFVCTGFATFSAGTIRR